MHASLVFFIVDAYFDKKIHARSLLGMSDVYSNKLIQIITIHHSFPSPSTAAETSVTDPPPSPTFNDILPHILEVDTEFNHLEEMQDMV